ITGPAGTGKSYVINLIIDDLKRKKSKYLLMSSTGISAQNINGKTIHSALRISESNGKFKTLIFSDNDYHLQEIDTLIIDEISMVSAGLLTFISDTFAKLKRNTIAFGGLNVILVGDLAQLPPVTGLQVYKSTVWKLFHPLFLTKSQRQDNDPLYNIVLQDIRCGNIT